MAQSHMIPFLNLAIKFEQKGYTNLSFVTTPLNLPYIQSCLPPSSSIRLLTIPFHGADHGLPKETEKTDNLPPHILYNFIMATISLKPAFTDLMISLSDDIADQPLCIISDMFFGWVSHVARQLGAFHLIFCGGGGFGFACYYSLSMMMNLPHLIKSNSDHQFFSLPDFQEAGQIHFTQVSPKLLAAGESDSEEDHLWINFVKKRLAEWTQSDGILINSVEEIDRLGLDYFRRVIKRPVWSIGPILSLGTPAADDEELYLKWLDSKPEKSVLYISFGSQYIISATQMVELAKALQVSDKNFIWVMRKPLGFDENSDFNMKKTLPEEFMQHVELGRGLLIEKWAPQVEILSHKSTSAFMSHCGWNSVLEALVSGVPIIGWPLAAEQCLNAKYLEECVGVCLEVARGVISEVTHEKIAEKIEIVMGERSEKGRMMRERANEVKEIMRSASRNEEGCFKGSSVKAMDEFLNVASLLMDV
ncbi:UDP-glycosyltransferase 92A1-like [Impatiens glandulifera]|uniref:UDP-glycosyltransferase 92A1-like n=1 Tax=Impatiens glandulifera TaxID=253017 RepID=UPI001FB11706|nr:UDP-glycosyltransferase 92A1-like [Impatiens glandulifera]